MNAQKSHSYLVYNSNDSSDAIFDINCGILFICRNQKELNTCKSNGVTVNYKRMWALYLLRMNDTRFPQVEYEQIPAGKRNVGRTRKRWMEQNT